MKVCHVVHADDTLASYRYRVAIPGSRLEAHGIDVFLDDKPIQDADIHVYHKHVFADQQHIRRTGGIFDITDDHFHHPELKDHYREMCRYAGTITCSSRELVKTVARETGEEAVYVPDPYEFPEEPCAWPGNMQRVMWFGNQVNFKTLTDVQLDCHLEIVIGCAAPIAKANVTMTPWSHEAMLRAFARSDFVIIPQHNDLKHRAKSNNRAVNALRQGRFVVASRIPSHEELEDWIYLVDAPKDILKGIVWAREHVENAEIMVAGGQAYVAREYDPCRVAGIWAGVFETHVAKAQSRVWKTSA